MNASNAINKGHIAKECSLNDSVKEASKPKQAAPRKSRTKGPFYFNPKSENKKLAHVIEAIVMNSSELANPVKKNIKVVGYQIKSSEKISISAGAPNSLISCDPGRCLKGFLLRAPNIY